MRAASAALCKQTLEQRNKDQANQRNTAAFHKLFDTLAFCTRIIVAVTLQQIDHTPNAKTSAKRDDKGLKNIDRRIKKLHIKTLPGTEEYVQTTLPFSGAPFKI